MNRNTLSRALSTLGLPAVFAAATMIAPAQAQNIPAPLTPPAAAPLPAAPGRLPLPLPTIPKPTDLKPHGFIPRAMDFFGKRAMEDAGMGSGDSHFWDFAMQQPLFEKKLAKKGLGLAVVGGTLSGNFANPKLNADRDTMRAMMGTRPGEFNPLPGLMFPSTNDTKHGTGVAFGVRFTFGH